MKKVWGFFWLIIAGLGGYALWCTIQLPSEAENIFLLGMTRGKLGLCAGIALLILFCLTGSVLSFSDRSSAFTTGKAAGIPAYIAVLLLVLGRIFLLPPVGKTALERSLLEKLTPLAYWGFAFAVLTLVVSLIQKWSEIRKNAPISTTAILWGFIVLFLMEAAIILALQTGMGITVISGTFYRQGVSLLEGHLIVPLLFLYILMPFFIFFEPQTAGKKAEPILTAAAAVLIWCAAVWLWQTTVFEGRSYFAPALRAPNNNFYPASDAENYDLLAQSILLGNGLRNGLTVVRPLYAAFLALLHFIFGNDYMRVTNGQIMLLALIPVIVFLIGRQMKQTPAGILTAAWMIWREIYSIRLSPLVQVSNSRLLMSDLPALLCLVLVILCTLKWYRSGRNITRALLCGGMIGTAMLLRTQCFVLLPALWLIFLCSAKQASKKWLSILFSIIGFLIVFAPWSVWQKIHPNTTVNTDVSETQYLKSLYQNAAGVTGSDKDIFHIITEHPAEIMQAIGGHFINNELSSLLILPMRLTAPEESDRLFYEENLFWYRESARPTLEANKTLLGVYLIVITIGVFSGFRILGFGGLIPFIYHIVYNLGNAFALTSGFRFILPSDWVLLFYFGLGCCAVTTFLGRVFLFDFNPEQISAGSVRENSLGKAGYGWAIAGSVLLLAVIGAVLPLCETVIPRHFSEKTAAQIEEEWRSSPDPLTADLSSYADDEIVFLEGRAFYPRFYKAGEGDSGGSSSAKRGLDMDRLVWMFQNQDVRVLSSPLTEEQVETMTSQPDPVDVQVVGIQHDDYVEILEMRHLSSQ